MHLLSCRIIVRKQINNIKKNRAQRVCEYSLFKKIARYAREYM